MRTLQTQSKMDEQALDNLLGEKQLFLEKALKNYILCLHTGVRIVPSNLGMYSYTGVRVVPSYWGIYCVFVYWGMYLLLGYTGVLHSGVYVLVQKCVWERKFIFCLVNESILRFRVMSFGRLSSLWKLWFCVS